MTSQNIVVGIQARLSSSRLPCKAMLSIGSTSLIGLLLRRSLSSGFITYLLTSDQPEDDILEREAHIACASGVIRGSIHDVRSRYFSLSEATNCDYLVRVTGDNPFTDFRIIQILVSHMRSCQSDYLWLDPGCCPDGINLEVFTPKLLQASIDNSVSPTDLEHVTPWMKSHMEHRGFWSDFYHRESFNYHLGIDIPDDYFKIINLLGDRCFDMEFLQSDAIVDWLIQRMIISSTYPRLRRHPL